jgi:hypothetical protein
LGTDYESIFFFQPDVGTRGGILMAAKDASMLLQNLVLTNHTITTIVLDVKSNTYWMVTGVYGPQGEMEKKCSLEN